MTMRRVKLLCTALMLLASHGALAVSYPLPPEGSRLVGSAFTIAVPDNNTQPLESFAAQYGRGVKQYAGSQPRGRCLFTTLRFDADYSATADPARHRAGGDRHQRRRNASLLLPAAGQQRRSAANRHWPGAGRETPRNWVTAVERKQEGPTGCQPPIPAASMRKRAKPCRRWYPRAR